MVIRRIANKRSFIGVVYDSEDSEEELTFCSTCATAGIISKLKHRLYLDGNGKRLPEPPYSDNWLQCWTCGLMEPIRDVKREGKISGINGIEPIDNPYDSKVTILGIDSKNRYRRLKQRKTKPTHPDKEVQKYLDNGW